MRRLKRDSLIVAGIAFIIIVASLYGKNRSEDTERHRLEEIFPAQEFYLEQVNGNKWHLSSSDLKSSWYLYTGSGKGYNGPINVLSQTDTAGKIIQLRITSHHETPSYFRKLEKDDFLEAASQIEISDYLSGEPVDAVTGATITSRAVMQGIRTGYSLGEDNHVAESRRVSFGPLEIIVLFLLITGLMLQRIRNRKVFRTVRWSLLIMSAIFLGFAYNQPLTISRIVAFINGYMPEVRYEFYIYLLLGGSVAALIFTGRNTYCHSVCPFGAVQEILGKTGRAKTFHPPYYRKLKYLQWSLTLLAVLLALFLNNPSLAQYEVFGALFQLTASNILFAVLIIVILTSLFVRRPWCNFMCPVGSIFSYISLIRNTIGKLWRQSVYR